MGVNFYLVLGLPFLIMIVSTLVGGGATLTGNCNGVNCSQFFTGSGTAATGTLQQFDCSSHTFGLFGGTPCFTSLPQNAEVTCSAANADGCYILNGCPSGWQNSGGLFCNSLLNILVCTAGCNAIINNGQGSGNTAYPNPFQFIFGSIGSAGFTPWVAIAIGVAVIASISFLGSGENSEGIHLLFVGGIILGIWTFLSGLEGFLAGDPNSFFIQLNTAPYIGSMQLGTIFYIGLSLMVALGTVGAASRGGGS